MPKLGSWNEKCNKKLLILLNKGATRGGVNHLNLLKEYIEGTVIAKFFPDRQYKTFNRLYRDKVNQYRINKTLKGTQNSQDGKSDSS